MPVYMLSEMPYDEFLGWFAYFDARPIGWREDDRAHKLLQAQGVKAKPEEIFYSLKTLAANKPADNGLKNSAFFLAMLNATEGKLPCM